jgi:hypothetical protein
MRFGLKMKSALRISVIVLSILILIVSIKLGSKFFSRQDGVDEWIEKTAKGSQKTRAVLKQAAHDYKDLLANSADREKSNEAYYRLLRTKNCGRYILKEETDDVFHGLLAQILNSYDRSRAWIKANVNMKGVHRFGNLESDWKSDCRFDVDKMEN